jgi:Fe-S-cluster-containing hydrogenase component 2
MENNPQEEKKAEEKSPSVSRRQMIVGVGAGAAGLVVGGVASAVIPRRKAPSPPDPDSWIGRNIEKCTGCRLCQVACSEIKEGKVQPGISRITVWQYYPGIEFPVACYQCGESAKCIEACPTEALSLDVSKKLNTIKIDKELCLRTVPPYGDCILCREKCPGLAVTFHPKTKEPLICDLCGGDPECIKACPTFTISVKGAKFAAGPPDEIAAGIVMAYKHPDPAKMPKPREGPGGPAPAAPTAKPTAAPAGRGRGTDYVPPDVPVVR